MDGYNGGDNGLGDSRRERYLNFSRLGPSLNECLYFLRWGLLWTSDGRSASLNHLVSASEGLVNGVFQDL